MVRVLIHVEGETEEAFVNQVLAPHLYPCGFTAVSARLLGNARQRARRGGIRPWPAARADILRHLREDRACLATTLVDYYALPATGAGAWPERARAGASPAASADARAAVVEAALARDIATEMGTNFDAARFMPFIVMHEFEALLFSDPEGFARGLQQPELARRLAEIRAAFVNPEEIDDGPRTAPSKRVEDLLPGYQKPFHGVSAARAIGLPAIRAACPHLSTWLTRLEAWPSR